MFVVRWSVHKLGEGRRLLFVKHSDVPFPVDCILRERETIGLVTPCRTMLP